MTNSEQDLEEKIKHVLAPILSVPPEELCFGFYPRDEGKKVRVEIGERRKAFCLCAEGSNRSDALHKLLWNAERYVSAC